MVKAVLRRFLRVLRDIQQELLHLQNFRVSFAAAFFGVILMKNMLSFILRKTYDNAYMTYELVSILSHGIVHALL